jgi:hypothetical protein
MSNTSKPPKEHLEFIEAVKPLIKYINDYGHPHMKIIVTPTSAELLEGVRSTGQMMDFVHD